MDMKAVDLPYEITALDDSKTSIFQSFFELINGSTNSSNALEWQMTATNHMENYDDEATGIFPGSQGVVSFYVKPHQSSVSLDLTFDILGYTYSSEDNSATTTTQTMTKADDALQNYINGHIFLFQNRTEVKNNESKVTSYIYSDPILPDENNLRVVANREFLQADQGEPVNIYWVWPRTLSTLVDASSNSHVTIRPFCSGDDYRKIVNYILENPNQFLYNYIQETDIDGNIITLSEELIAQKYDKYGDLYDRADNQIGMNVQYITLKMITAQSTTGGA